MVAMKQAVTRLQAERRNQTVNRFSYRVAVRPQIPIVPGSGESQLCATGFEHLKLQEFLPNLEKCIVVANSLQDLAKDQVCEAEPLSREFAVQPFSFRVQDTPEIV